MISWNGRAVFFDVNDFRVLHILPEKVAGFRS
jgi:hypothetical protein